MIHKVVFTSGDGSKMYCSVGDTDDLFGKCVEIDTAEHPNGTFDVTFTMNKETEDGVETYQFFHPYCKLDYIIR